MGSEETFWFIPYDAAGEIAGEDVKRRNKSMKKKKKRLLSLVMSVSLLLGLLPAETFAAMSAPRRGEAEAELVLQTEDIETEETGPEDPGKNETEPESGTEGTRKTVAESGTAGTEEAAAEPSAEVIEEPSTEPETEAMQEPSTEPETEAAQEPSTEPETEAAQEASTEPATEAAQEPSTEPATKAAPVLGILPEPSLLLSSAAEMPLTFSLEAKKETYEPGETAEIVLMGSAPEGTELEYFSLSLMTDSEDINGVSFEASEAVKEQEDPYLKRMIEYYPGDGGYGSLWANGIGLTAEVMEIGTLSFSISEEIPAGSYTVKIANANAYDKNGGKYNSGDQDSITLTPAAITIAAYENGAVRSIPTLHAGALNLDGSGSTLYAGGWKHSDKYDSATDWPESIPCAYQSADNALPISLSLKGVELGEKYLRTKIVWYSSDTAEYTEDDKVAEDTMNLKKKTGYTDTEKLTKAMDLSRSFGSSSEGEQYITAVVTNYFDGEPESLSSSSVLCLRTLPDNASLYDNTNYGVYGYYGAEPKMTIPAKDSNGNNIRLVEQLSDDDSVTGTTKVVISEGITAIGEYAFKNVIILKDAFIPKTVTRVGSQAFYDAGSQSGKLTLTFDGNDGDKPDILTDIVNFETLSELTVRCHEGSAAEAWAKKMKEEHPDQVKIRLIELDRLGISLKDSAGLNLTADAFSSIEWFKEGSDEVLASGILDYTPEDEVSAENRYLCKVTFKRETRTQYVVPVANTFTFEKLGAYSLTLTPREQLTVKGKFKTSQIFLSGFKAALTYTIPGINGEEDTKEKIWLNPDYKGEFSETIPRYPVSLYAEARDGGYRLTKNDIQMYPAVEEAAAGEHTVDMGTLELIPQVSRRIVSKFYRDRSEIDIMQYFFNPGSKSKIMLIDENGEEFTDFTISNDRIYTLGELNFVISLGTSAWERFDVGDKLTLKPRRLSDYSSGYTFEPCEIVLDQDSAKCTPEFSQRGKLYIPYKGNYFVFDQNGTLLKDLKSGYNYLDAGIYTIVGFNENNYFSDIDFPDALELAGIDPSMYYKDTITMKNGDTYQCPWNLPEIRFGEIAVEVTVGKTQRVGDLVPVYIQYRDPAGDALGSLYKGDVLITVYSRQETTLPLEKTDGKYATLIGDGELKEEETITSSGGYRYAALKLKSSLNAGTICLYARADGSTLYFSTAKDGSTVRSSTSVTLPGNDVSMTPINSTSYTPHDNVHLYTALPSEGAPYKAAVYVDDKKTAENTRLSVIGMAENTIPYTLTEEETRPGVYKVNVSVTDKNDQEIWRSEDYPVLYTPKRSPKPTRLGITLIATGGNRPGSFSQRIIDLTKENVKYGKLKFTTYPNLFYSDNTLNMTLNYHFQVDFENADMMDPNSVKMIIYRKNRKGETYVKVEPLRWDEEEEAYTGSYLIKPGTFTLNSLPYGYDVVYDYENKDLTMSKETAAVQLEAYAKERKQLIPEEEAAVPQLHDMELVEMALRNLGPDTDESVKNTLRAMYVMENKAAEAYNQMQKDSVEKIRKLCKDSDLEDTPVDTMEAVKECLSRIMENSENTDLTWHEEEMDPDTLRAEGYVEADLNGTSFYVKNSPDGKKIFMIEPETGMELVLDADAQGTSRRAMRSLSRSGEEGDSLRAQTEDVRFYVGIANSMLSSACDYIDSFAEAVKAYDAVPGKYVDLQEVLEMQKSLVEYHKSIDSQWIGKLAGEASAMSAELEGLRNELNNAIEILNDFGQIDNKKLEMLRNIADKLGGKYGKLTKIVPGIGAAIGTILDIIDILDAYDYSASRIEALERNRDWAKEQLRLMESGEMCGSGGVPAGSESAWNKQLEKCRENAKDMVEQAEDAIFWATALGRGKITIGAGNLATSAAGFIPAAKVATMVAEVGLFTGGNLWELGCKVGVETNWNNVADLSAEVSSNCAVPEGVPCSNGESASVDQNPDMPIPTEAVIDPSGYVYEAVVSNRVEGAVARIYYKNDAGEETYWSEAEEYGEINPQTTNEKGEYGWMTPMGSWKVKITKDGYLPADSSNDPEADADGWLPVPPPQVNVNIGLVSTETPTVLSSEAASQQLRVVFSQYMDTAQLAEGSLVHVVQDGVEIPVKISFEDQEESPTKSGVFYGRSMKLQRADGKAFAGSGIIVNIAKEAKNYAGTTMAVDYTSAPLTVGRMIGRIVHSYPNRFVTELDVDTTVAVQVLDTDGKPMSGITVTTKPEYDGYVEIDSQAITDDNGRAVFTVHGVAEGEDTVRFKAGTISTDLKIGVIVRNAAPNKPTANLEDYGVVDKGTKLIISADQGAVIRYTTDNTCPCTDKALTYTEPITLNESGYYRIAAWTAEGGYSERLNLHITVRDASDSSGGNTPGDDPGNNGGGSGNHGGSSSGGSDSDGESSSGSGSKGAASNIKTAKANQSGSWVQNEKGWWYRYNDGTWPADKWVSLPWQGMNYWYFFNADGYMTMGWFYWKDHWYYMNPVIGANSGKMMTGWQLINGKWYYLTTDKNSSEGIMFSDTMTPDGYHVGKDGAWIQ